MEQYDKNVTVILEFLIAEKFSASVISLHRLCYKALRKHLTEESSILARSIALTSWRMYILTGSYYLITWVQGAPHTAYCQKH